ncbi:MAG: DUF1489 domain-containing protein [Pseudomonadota bacterium]
MPGTVNLLKLCVGAESPDDLIHWQQQRRLKFPDKPLRHVTRMWPKRGPEILNGGSLYWVFKGAILARQTIVGLEEVIGEDGIRRCGILLDNTLIRTFSVPKRPFQGWRYLSTTDAPKDLPKGQASDDDLPPELANALDDIGLR